MSQHVGMPLSVKSKAHQVTEASQNSSEDPSMTEQDDQLIEEKSRHWNSHTVDCRLLGMAHKCRAPVAAREAAADIGDNGTYLR